MPGLVVLLVFVFIVQGARHLWERDEGRYTDIAVNMIQDGDYMHPRLNHEVAHYAKPPLVYWAIAQAVATFGRFEWAARLPNTLAFLLTLWCVYRLGRYFVPRDPVLPAIIYGTSVLPLGAANYVNADTLLTSFDTLGILLLASLLWGERPRRFLLSCAAGGVFGLAFLAKGPPGWLPLLALGGYALSGRGRWREVSGRVALPAFTLFAALVGGAWFLAVTSNSPDLWHYFVDVELKDRVFSDRFHRNSEWYGALKVYLPTLALGFLPWSAVAFFRGGEFVGLLRGFSPKADSRILFLVFWFTAPMLVFFIARSRLPLYVLPCFAPLSLLAARALVRVLPRRTLVTVAVSSGLAVPLLLLALSVYPYRYDARTFAEEITRRVPSLQEVVFVSARPYFGLYFYLNAQVEQVELDESTGEGSLHDELRETEPGRVWLVPDSRAGEFEADVRLEELDTLRLGHIPRFAIYATGNPAPGAMLRR
jgi:4-amino-4-deoxy-L-arabinose transferase